MRCRLEWRSCSQGCTKLRRSPIGSWRRATRSSSRRRSRSCPCRLVLTTRKLHCDTAPGPKAPMTGSGRVSRQRSRVQVAGILPQRSRLAADRSQWDLARSGSPREASENQTRGDTSTATGVPRRDSAARSAGRARSRWLCEPHQGRLGGESLFASRIALRSSALCPSVIHGAGGSPLR